MEDSEWLKCPVCGGKTHNKIRVDTILKNLCKGSMNKTT